MDNILHSNLYRPGSVAYLSRSGGMSNELNIIISQTTVCTRAWPSWATLTCSPPTRSSGMPEPEPALGPPRRPPRPRMLLWAAREAVVPPSFDELGDKIRKVKTGTIGGAAAPRPHGLQLGEGARAHQETTRASVQASAMSAARSCSTPGSPSRRCSGRTWASAACSPCSGSSGDCRHTPASSWRCV